MPNTRQRARLARDAPSSLLLELMPDAIVIHMLQHASARTLARVACVNRDFQAHVPAVVPLRAAHLGYRRPSINPGEHPLHALDYIEISAARAPCTISADTCHTITCTARGGQRRLDGAAWDARGVFAWGGHEQGPEPEGDHGDEPACWLLHLGLGRETGPAIHVPQRVPGLVCIRLNHRCSDEGAHGIRVLIWHASIARRLHCI